MTENQPPMPQLGQVSPDGQFVWNGNGWVPNPNLPKKSHTVRNVLLGMVGVAILLFAGCVALIGGAANEVSKSIDKQEHQGAPQARKSGESPKARYSFEDDVLTTPDMKLEITRHRVIPVGAKGNEYGSKPVIAFWYKVTNLTQKDLDPMTAFILDFTAYQDNNPNAENELEVGSLPDDRFLDTQMENIKKGGTVENAVAFELDDKTTPVELVASDDLGMSEIGRATYSLQ